MRTEWYGYTVVLNVCAEKCRRPGRVGTGVLVVAGRDCEARSTVCANDIIDDDDDDAEDNEVQLDRQCECVEWSAANVPMRGSSSRWCRWEETFGVRRGGREDVDETHEEHKDAQIRSDSEVVSKFGEGEFHSMEAQGGRRGAVVSDRRKHGQTSWLVSAHSVCGFAAFHRSRHAAGGISVSIVVRSVFTKVSER